MSDETTKKLDLHGVICPMNFVKAKMALEELVSGERLEILLDEGEALRDVPKSLKEEGHKIIKVEPEGETFRVLVEKG